MDRPGHCDRPSRGQLLRTTRLGRTLVTAVAVAGLLLPAVAAAQEPTTEELERELDRATGEVDDLDAELGDRKQRLVVAEERLAEVGARLVDARGRLRAAEGQLALAEVAEAEAEEERQRTDRAHRRSERALAETEDELETQERNLATQAAAAYKFGSAGARASSMAFEVVRHAEDPNELAVGMRSIGTVIGAQGELIVEVSALRDEHQERSDEAARTRAVAAQAAADATAQVRATAELREDAEVLARDVAADEEQQATMVRELRASSTEAEAAFARVSSRQGELADQLAARRVAEEATSSGAGGGGGPTIAGGVCPVVGAVAGRDFSDTWGAARSGGRSHQGTDVFADRGAPIVAIHDAVVTKVSRSDIGLGGLTVTYRTSDGSEWYNAHLESVEPGLAAGTTLDRGQRVGTVGTSGNARGTPPHDHVGRRYGGAWVNPWPTLSTLCR